MNGPVSIATRWTVGFRFQAWARDFSLLHYVQIASGSHPSYYTLALSREVKRSGREANPSPLSDEVKVGEAIPPLSLTFSWRDA
jgi:hypothetical protein